MKNNNAKNVKKTKNVKNTKNVKKTKNGKNTKNLKVEIDVIHQITMLLQIGLAVFLISFGVASFFCKELYMVCQVLIGFIMFVIAFNNHKIYKRKYMTAIYVGLGIVIIAAALFA